MAVVVTPFAFLVRDNGSYTTVASGRNQTADWDVYREAHAFQDAVLDAVPSNRSVGFWYGPEPSLSSIQSTFLYDVTRVFDASDQMPNVTPALLASIGRFDYLVLLGVSPRQVTDATHALCDAGASLRQVRRMTLHGDAVNTAFAIFRRTKSGGCTGLGTAA